MFAANSLANGIWIALWAVYFVSVADVSPAVVSTVSLFGGVAGMALAYPVGSLGDRVDDRYLLALLLTLRGIAALLVSLSSSTVLLLAALFITLGLQSAQTGLSTSIVATRVDPMSRVKSLSWIRTLQHVLYALTAVAASLVLASGAEIFFRIALAIGGTMLFAGALMCTRISRRSAVTSSRADRRIGGSTAVKDQAFLLMMLGSSLLMLCWPVLTVGLPLWITESTVAPPAMAGVCLAISAIIIITIQIPVGNKVVTLKHGRYVNLAGSIFLSVVCAGFVIAGETESTRVAVAIILGVTLLHALAEVLVVTSKWYFSTSMMNDDHAGGYQSIAAIGDGLAVAVGPAIMIALVGTGNTGWCLLGLTFFIVGVFQAIYSRRILVRTAERAGPSMAPKPEA
ncbi:MFS transporter [Rhodococcus sp. NPDC060084]|uniref:MFS transporter n=2 Tax=unclassified Rhodococcus (in: high G+C Gram-positive bacteria) TaxID=192944 RepID=UPI00365FCB12